MFELVVKERNSVIISTVFILVNLLVYVFIINGSFHGSDYGNYLQGANSLAGNFIYSTQGDPLVPDNFRPVGYSLVIVLSKAISLEYFIELIVFMQSTLLLVMFGFVVKLLTVMGLYDYRVIYASAMMFVHPVVLHTTTQIQVDLLLSFSIFSYVYYFVLFLLNGKNKDLFVSVALLAMSFYFRPTFMYFIPFFLVIIYKYSNVKNAVFSIIVIILIQSPWIIRNKIVLDTYKISMLGDVVLTYFAADTLRHSLNLSPDAAHSLVWRECDIDEPYWENKNDMSMYSRMKKESIGIMMDNAEYFMLSWLRGIARVFLMPHEIYVLKSDTTIPVDDFIGTLKSDFIGLVEYVNGYFVYLYFVAYAINVIIVYSVVRVLYNVGEIYKKIPFVYHFLVPFCFYGLLIPGPINKPHYMFSYYIVLIVFVAISFFKNKPYVYLRGGVASVK